MSLAQDCMIRATKDILVIDYKGDKVLPLCSNCGDCIFNHEPLKDHALVCKHGSFGSFTNPNVTDKEVKDFIKSIR